MLYSKAASNETKDSDSEDLDKYLNQQIAFLGQGVQKSNAVDPKAKEEETYKELSRTMTFNSELQCKLTEDKLKQYHCPKIVCDVIGKSSNAIGWDDVGFQVQNTEFRQIGGVDKISTVVTKCEGGSNQDRPWVVFLHGKSYTTRNWIEINMLRLTAKFGFNNVAIDLPGSCFAADSNFWPLQEILLNGHTYTYLEITWWGFV